MKLKSVFLCVALALPGIVKAQQLSYLDSLSMVQVDTLEASIVEADRIKRRAATQTSLTRISGDKISRGFAALGTKDLVKQLQLLPGVSSGTELMSGLYVRGGDGSDNLFLLDMVPMYQISHLIGLFSSFNTDVIDAVDFYKGGFPARYGGRLSSVVDVMVKEGNFDKWEGSASLGAVDGRIQIEGPIIKGKTSLNFGMRRTWTDVMKNVAMLFIDNPVDEAMAAKTHYDFGDFNLKLAHRINKWNKLSFSSYYGQDLAKAGLGFDESYEDEVTKLDMDFNLKWGNTLANLRWDRVCTDNLFMDLSLYHTNYTSSMNFITTLKAGAPDSMINLKLDETNLSRVYDTGVHLNFFSRRYAGHTIRYGADGVIHVYDPNRSAGINADMLFEGSLMPIMKETTSESNNYRGGEIALYGEDEMSFGKKYKLNVGMRTVMYLVSGRSYFRAEPRIAGKMYLGDSFYLKSSFATMNQFTHQVAAVYLDLPTNLWMPSTAKIKPMHSDQFVLGLNATFPYNITFDVECFYKTMSHLYEYTGTNTILPRIEKWEEVFFEGKGRSYGAEFMLEYQNEKLEAAVYYTLSRSERKFESFYYDWYPDRNDNLHRLTLTASYRFNKKFELYGAWIYHTGNRFTALSSYVDTPDGHKAIYGMPNAYMLPAYHRLDLGFNWHHKTRRGAERTFNISLYNAYNHLNAMFGFIDDYGDSLKGYAYGIIPIIPSISYMWKF